MQEGPTKKLRTSNDLESLLCQIPRDVFAKHLIPHLGALAYYQLLLASPALYRTLVWKADNKLTFRDAFMELLWQELERIEMGLSHHRASMLVAQLTVGSNAYLCGSFLLAVLQGESGNWNDMDIVRTGFTRNEQLFDQKTRDALDMMEAHFYDGLTETIRPLNSYDPMLHEYINEECALHATAYCDKNVVAVINVFPFLQFIYYPNYACSVPNFHFDFCRVSFGNGKLRFHGNLESVLKKRCRIDVAERFFKQHRYILSSTTDAVKCIQKYRRRGYTVELAPLPDALQIEEAGGERSRYLERQSVFLHQLTNSERII